MKRILSTALLTISLFSTGCISRYICVRKADGTLKCECKTGYSLASLTGTVTTDEVVDKCEEGHTKVD